MITEPELNPTLEIYPEAAASRFYRPELDVMRFFAFLMVFFSHTWPSRATAIANHVGVPLGIIHGMIDAGALGVFVFFMLSSYLITELLLLEKEKTHNIHVKAYYLRRILRIWPLYFLFIGLALVIGLVIPFYRLPGRELAMMMLLSGNWYFAQHGWGTGFVSHLWSISVEEQFYLAWPIFLKLGGRQTLRVGCIALAFLSLFSLSFLGLRNYSANPVVFVNSFVLCCFFALGGITALSVRRRTPRLPIPVRSLLIFFGIAMFLVATASSRIHDDAVISVGRLVAGYLLACIGCLSIFFAFLGAVVPSWARILIFLGKISYGLYVFHLLCAIMTEWFVKDVLHHEHWPLTVPFALLLTILFASLSYRFVERPFLKLKERFVFIQSRRV